MGICAILLAAVLAPVISIVLKVISARIRLQHYKRQGVPIYFHPLLGNQAIFSRDQLENKVHSNLEYAKKLSNESSVGAFAVNTFSEETATLFVHKSELVREFLLHEDHYIKAPIVERVKDELGLFFQNGDKALRSKALFTKIFSYDGMDSLAPKVCEIIKDSFVKFDKTNKISAESYSQINLEQLYDPVMARIANLIVKLYPIFIIIEYF